MQTLLLIAKVTLVALVATISCLALSNHAISFTGAVFSQYGSQHQTDVAGVLG